MNDTELTSQFAYGNMHHISPGWGSIPTFNVKGVEVFDVRGVFPDENHWGTPVLKSGWAVHHTGMKYSGSSVDEALARINSAYNWHTNLNGRRDPGGSSWNGIGYHFMGDPQGRVYWTGDFDTHRAHVAGASNVNAQKYNHFLLGYCHIGNFSDLLAPDGQVLARGQDKPTAAAMSSMWSIMQAVSEARDLLMQVRPHKFYQNKDCHGSWVDKDWERGVLGVTSKPPEWEPLDPSEIPLISATKPETVLKDELTDIHGQLCAAVDNLRHLIGRG